jgi:hypothetical protein
MNSDGEMESEGEGLDSARTERGEKTTEADVPGDSSTKDEEEELEEGPNDKVLTTTLPSGCTFVSAHTSLSLHASLLHFLPDAHVHDSIVGGFLRIYLFG